MMIVSDNDFQLIYDYFYQKKVLMRLIVYGYVIVFLLSSYFHAKQKIPGGT